MKFNLIKLFLLSILLVSCSKKAPEYFQDAELNLDEDKIEIAIENLETLVKKFPKDSLAAVAQYKLAFIYLKLKNDLTNGLSALEKTIDNYENSVQGKEAQKELMQFPEWIFNQSETLRKNKKVKESLEHLVFLIDNYKNHIVSSKGQYLIGDIYMNDLRDFPTAIQELRKVSENYKDSSQEPHARFMIGYIFANYLNDYESAKIEYELFLNLFPSHELVPSVEFELKYLGKNINEIPALKHISTS
tara:strand:- start:57853 stop:58590 length:738 start_codon:yes stop_codon:yes gene_type:complete